VPRRMSMEEEHSVVGSPLGCMYMIQLSLLFPSFQSSRQSVFGAQDAQEVLSKTSDYEKGDPSLGWDEESKVCFDHVHHHLNTARFMTTYIRYIQSTITIDSDCASTRDQLYASALERRKF
jgi:hypothetical protein